MRLYNPHINKLTQGPLVVTSLAIQKSPRVLNFIILTIVCEFLKQEMLGSLRMVRSMGMRIHKSGYK